MKRHGGNLNTYCYVKKKCLKRLHTLRFQPYDILENAKYRDSKKINVARGLEEERKGRMDSGACRIFRVVKLFCIMYTVMVDTSQYTFLSMHRAAVQQKV